MADTNERNTKDGISPFEEQIGNLSNEELDGIVAGMSDYDKVYDMLIASLGEHINSMSRKEILKECKQRMGDRHYLCVWFSKYV